MSNTECCPAAAVRRLAAGQHGVVSRRQAIEAGMTARMIQWRLQGAEWVAIHPGVYRLDGVPVTWHQRVLAAALATGGVASHRSAARLWGLDLPPTERAVVTIVTSGRRSMRGVMVHRTRSLSGADRAVREGIPCTSVGRTLVDLAGEVGFDDLEACVDSALRDNLATVRYLERWLPAQGKGGAAGLRELVDDRRRHRPFGSRREAQVSRMLVAAGLPRPTAQHELRDERGRLLARFDLAWPDWRVAVEFASYRHHFGRRAWRSDTARANRATAHGWRVLTATDLDLGDACRSLASGVGAARAGLSSVPA